MTNNWMLDFSFAKPEYSIQHGDKLLFMGSCFSDELSARVRNAGFQCFDYPFGTIFHPSVLALSILASLDEGYEERVFQAKDSWFSWDASTTMFASAQDQLISDLKTYRTDFVAQLKECNFLMVTLGSAWGYELIEDGGIVANCHKQPSSSFQKFLSSPYEMVQDWIIVLEKLRELNPSLQVVFTVSPVRHVRDGLVENNLSKARLIEVTQQLCMEENTYYFPSYELLIDVLRDYRFYAKDLVHPNELAVDHIWEVFRDTFHSVETNALVAEVEGVKRMFNHRSRNPEGKEHQLFLEQAKKKMLKISQEHPFVYWD